MSRHPSTQSWDHECDVVVVGSGGAALTAAITASDRGARVQVLERATHVGGTTALSGGMVWAPLNHRMADLGVQDSREEALAYCRAAMTERGDEERWETFVDTAHQMVGYLEAHTPVRFSAMTYPDSFAERPGGKTAGRNLEPLPFPKRSLGAWKDRVRPSTTPALATFEEIHESWTFLNPLRIPKTRVALRAAKGEVTMGNALVAGLLKGCLDRGVQILLGTRVRTLLKEDGRVIGVQAEQEGREVRIRAPGGVILACGGFEWNITLKEQYLPGPILHPPSVPENEGDGLVMAAEAGAALAQTDEAWWWPVGVAGKTPTATEPGRLILGERCLPHSIFVNRSGQRFVNESSHNVANAFCERDGDGLRNVPCWAIFDRQYRSRYAVLMTVLPKLPDPDWLVKEQTPAALARRVGIEAASLEQTVARFNEFARNGKDLDFSRGDFAYDRYNGDPEAPHPNLGTVEKPPFYALPIYPSAVGTKGGPQTNVRGEVIDTHGDVIPDLYAAGNVMAAVFGPGTLAGGATLGVGMTWGYLCGIHAARAARANKEGE